MTSTRQHRPQNDARITERKDLWKQRGHDVYVEGQNAFRLRSQTATLAGRPHIITVWKDDALITDVKAGREQPWHKVQIMIYMYALAREIPQYRDIRLAGEIVYPIRTVKVPRGSCHGQFIRDLGSLICRLADDECNERIDDGAHPEDRTTEDF